MNAPSSLRQAIAVQRANLESGAGEATRAATWELIDSLLEEWRDSFPKPVYNSRTGRLEWGRS